MNHDNVDQIPEDRVVTYTQIVVNFRPQKEDPNQVQITAGGNLIQNPGELATQTADLTTSKYYGTASSAWMAHNLWRSMTETFIWKLLWIDMSI